MNRNDRQTVCTLLALSAPLAHYGGRGYMAVILAAIAILPLTVLAGDGLKRISKAEAVAELVWTGVVLGSLIGVSGANWPGNRSEIVVPLGILPLALISGRGERSEQTCATLFRIVMIPGILVLVKLIGTAELKWMAPEPGNWTPGLVVSLLYPALNGAVGGTKVRTAWYTALLAGLLALMIQSGIGMIPAENMDSPLYELGRCVGTGGFEIIVSVLLTFGWYGFASIDRKSVV